MSDQRHAIGRIIQRLKSSLAALDRSIARQLSTRHHRFVERVHLAKADSSSHGSCSSADGQACGLSDMSHVCLHEGFPCELGCFDNGVVQGFNLTEAHARGN